MSNKTGQRLEYCPNQKGCKYVEMAVEIGKIGNKELPVSKSEQFNPNGFRKLDMINRVEYEDGIEYSCKAINKCISDMYSTTESKNARCSYLSMVQKILNV